jgi:hypothetical protein
MPVAVAAQAVPVAQAAVPALVVALVQRAVAARAVFRLMQAPTLTRAELN